MNGDEDHDVDALWGRRAIAAELGLKPSQFSYLLARGFFADAVRRIGHRTYVGSKKLLRQRAAELATAHEKGPRPSTAN